MNEQFLENKKEFNFTVRQFQPIAAQTAHGPRLQASSCALPRAQAATWAWAGNSASRSIPPGPRRGSLHLGRPRASDGRARV